MLRYRVLNWDDNFENSKSRERQQCSFVCVPNKQHGMGFTHIMSLPDGRTIYGVWCLIIGALSQQKKRDGWMTHDGYQTGTAWASREMALRWRSTTKEIDRALQVLSGQEVAWISSVECQSDTREVPARCPPGALEEKEEKEEKEVTPAVADAYPSGMMRFWASAPQTSRTRSSRDEVFSEWKKQKLEAIADRVIGNLIAWGQTPGWRDENGKFVPGLHKWLRSGRWKDAPSNGRDHGEAHVSKDRDW